MPDLWAELHPGHTILPNPNLGSAYPKWIDAPQGRVIVHSRSEEQDAMAGQEPRQLPRAAAPVVSDPEIGEKALLQLEAQNMGVTVDRRWGVSRLRKAIAEHR